MKSSPSGKRRRLVPSYTYYLQIISGLVNENLSDLLCFGSFTSEEYVTCDDGKSRPLWSVELDIVKTVYKSQNQSDFEVWRSANGNPPRKVTVSLRKTLFRQRPRRASKIKKGSEIEQPF